MYSVLILDDNKPVATQIFRTIPWDDIGCQVIGVFNDGISGKEAIERFKPDLIISDVEMPGLTGLQMIEYTQSYIPDSQLIFISAYEKFNYAYRAIKLGACDYLLKPFTQSELRQAIDSAVARLGSREKKEIDPGAERSYSALMESVVDYLRTAAYGPVTLETVADYFKISPSKLGRLIKKETDMRYVELVTSMRMQRAKELLAVPYLTISEIAERVGYSDYLTFYKVFVRCEKISPGDYRRNLNSGKDIQDED